MKFRIAVEPVHFIHKAGYLASMNRFGSLLLWCILSLVPFQAHAQEEEDTENDKPGGPVVLQCQAGWYVGDTMLYEVHRTRRDLQAETIVKDNAVSFLLNVAVEDSSEAGYRLSWRRELRMVNVSTAELPKELTALLDSIEHFVIHVRTEPSGSLLEIENRDHVLDRWTALLGSFAEMYIPYLEPEKQENFKRVLEKMSENRDLMAKDMLEEIDMFFMPYGMYVVRGAPYTQPFALPNVLTGGTMPAVATIALAYEDVVNYEVTVGVDVDREGFAKALRESMKELGKIAGTRKRFKRKDIPEMDLHQQYSFVLDTDRGWLRRARYDQTLRTGNTGKDQTITFSTAIPAEEPMTELELDDRIVREPHDPSGYRKRGWLRAKRAYTEGAIEDFSMAINIDPEDARTYFWRATVYQETNQNDLAMLDLDHAILLDSTQADFFEQRGDVLMEMHRFADSEAALNTALRLDPEHLGARFSMAYVMKMLYRFEEALAQYDEAVRIAPDRASTYGTRASVRFDMRTPEQDSLAMVDLRKALDLDPKSIATLATLGNRFLDLQQNDSAIHYYDMILALDPNDRLCLHNRGYAHMQAGRQKEAIRDFEECLELDSDFAFAHNNMGWALHLDGRSKEALPHIERSIAMQPENAYAFYNKGRVLQVLGRTEEACAAWDHAIAIGFRKGFGDMVDQELAKHCGR